MPKWSLRSIVEAFGRPLGSLRGSFGATFALLGPSWHPFGDHFGLLGRPVALSWRSWDNYGRKFDGFDVQITNKQLFQTLSFAAPIIFANLIGICHVHLAFVRA